MKRWGPENTVKVENGGRAEIGMENRKLRDYTPEMYHFLDSLPLPGEKGKQFGERIKVPGRTSRSSTHLILVEKSESESLASNSPRITDRKWECINFPRIHLF